MELLLEHAAQGVVLVVQLLAISVVAFGVGEVLVTLARALATGKASTQKERTAWLRFARWLVAALTLQLAADIVATAVAPTWDEIGRLAAIAATRTFLSHFLDRDIEAVRERQERAEARASHVPG